MRICWLTVLLVATQACSSGLAADRAALHSALQSIQLAELREHVETLASDSFEGREAGRAGGRAAATYLMKQLKQSQLSPAGLEHTYFQPFGSGYRNVLAELPGNDPQLQHEFILLTAHYDHVGYGSRKTSNGPVGYIHNGADDNASGVACLLEVAEAMQSAFPEGLRRSVLFVWWDAEEKGLWGSKHWLAHPTRDPANIRLMVNVDMVGRLRHGMQLFGTRSMPGLRYLWSTANLDPTLRLQFPWQIVDNSDHYPFFERGIPFTMIHTGLHEDYHRPSDDASRVNIDGIAQASALLLRCTVHLANADILQGFRAECRHETAAQQRRYEQAYASRRRLGISWWRSRTDNGLSINAVRRDSPAAKAGLRPGDRITHVRGNRLEDVDQLRRAVAATFGVLPLEVVRGQELIALEVRLGGTPPRVGISWRSNSAEPGAVMVTEVTPDYPAERAGLQVGDRIHQINAEPIKSDDQFHETLTTASGKVVLLVERAGQLQQRTVQLEKLASADGE